MFIEDLKANKKALNKQENLKLFEDYARLTNPDKNIYDIDDLFEYLESDDDWYNLIFKGK